MQALLDVNVLISLLDPNHAFHGRAAEWLRANVEAGWASCPITQNGCLRIMSHPSYPNPLPVGSIIERLREAASSAHHTFWSDKVSLLDTAVCSPARIHGPRQITDLYLLALAVGHAARFVTFDTAIPLAAIKRATKDNLVVL